jgi:hypothetical protein
MNRRPSDVDARLIAWLEEGSSSGPDEVLSRAFARARSTRQDRVWLHRLIQPTRSYAMNSMLKVAAVAVFTLAVGAVVLPRGPDIGAAPAPSASPPPSPSPLSEDWVPLTAGTYVTTPFAAPGSDACLDQADCLDTSIDDDVRVTFSVPDGWEGSGRDGVAWSGGPYANTAGLIFTRGASLYDDPCVNDGTPDIPVGPSVDDFANAVAGNPLLETTTPVDVSLAGYAGKYIELQVPTDLTGCSQFRPWEPWYYAQDPGELWRLWVLDVAGLRVVVQAIDHADTSPQIQAQLQGIVDSVAIEPPPAPLRQGPLAAGTYTVSPFGGDEWAPCGPAEDPCPEAAVDDGIRFTFTVPEGWAGAPFGSDIWLATEHNSGPAGAGFLIGRGGWLYSDPCVGEDPDVPVGPTVDDFVDALVTHPALDVTEPVQVVLGGYAGKYLDLQAPADLSDCPDNFVAWDPTFYAQGPSNLQHIWVIDVDGVRVVIHGSEFPDTAPERSAELREIVDSFRIERDPALAPSPAASLAAPSLRSPGTEGVTNGWIAFSSQPHAGQVMATDGRRGGDIYLAHDSDDLRMLVSRGPGMDTNVCPAFSPDGTRLAYGEQTDAGIAIVILDLAADGSIERTSRLPLDTTSPVAPCPRWSVDGTRIGSLEARNIVIVRGLDGSIVEARTGDPTFADFAYGPGPLGSPSGEHSVRMQNGEIIVHPADGSPERTIAGMNPYAIAGWSPDSTKLLLMRDVSGHDLQLSAVSIDEPFAVEVVADVIPVNGARSWPERRDLSWQTLFE